MSEVANYIAALMDKVRKSWGWFLVTGILIITLGVLCVGRTQIAAAFSILALGWILVISAALWLTCALFTFGLYGITQYLFNPIIRGLVGYLLITHPDVGAEGLAVILSALFIVLGLFRALTASVYRFPRWEWSVFAGLVSFCLGAYLLSTSRAAGTYLFALLIGLDLIADGTALIGFAIALHGSPEVQRKPAW
jgi:uncharacterized membrane protein HdeD (DUF308 family)